MASIDRLGTDGATAPPLEVGTWWYAGVAGEATRSFTARVRKRLRGAALGVTLLMAVGYAGLALTATGQRWENTATVGRLTDGRLSAAAVLAHPSLHDVTVYSLGLALLLIAAVGILRKRYALTVTALATVIGCMLLAELLQRYVLPRPDLVNAPRSLMDGGFPSGHTTIAMSAVLALVLVVPYRMRWLAVGAGALWAAAIGAYTLAAGWHRPGDLVGADLLALAIVCGLVAVLARKGRVRPAPRRRFPVRTALVALSLAVAAAGGLAAGVVRLLGSTAEGYPADPSLARLAYESGQLLAAGSCAAAALLLLVLLRHVDLDDGTPVPRRRPLRAPAESEITGPFPPEHDHEIS